MAVTREEFAVLTALAGGVPDKALSPSAIRSCEESGLISGQHLSAAGEEALAPYRVTNAIIMAAGLSQRFAPISYERPKGLLRVRGEILIERQITQLQEAGIDDITVVVGYKRELFSYLADKYGVSLVVNDEYATRNNNSTLWVARHALANTYICCSDNYYLDNPFERYVFESFYSTPFVEGPTDEWCVTTAPDGSISSVTIGGSDSLVMVGPAYFDRTFSTTFRRLLEEIYHEPETANKFWEDIFVEHVSDLHMVAHRFPDGMINEFDSLAELREFDPEFIENVESRALDNISRVFACPRNDIHDFFPLKQGITNLSCHFAIGHDHYVYRHPGVGTEKMIDRQAEFAALHLASELGLDHTFVAGDPAEGWKISRFVADARMLNYDDPRELEAAMALDRRLHGASATLTRHFDYVSEGLAYEELLAEHGPIEIPGYAELKEKVFRLKAYTDADNYPLCPSHNDFFKGNFLVDHEGNLNLIDWEYAGMSDIASDFASMTSSDELSDDAVDQAIGFYFGRQPTFEERRHFWAYTVLAGWCWYLWALAKEAEGDDVGEWLDTYHRRAIDYVDRVLDWYTA